MIEDGKGYAVAPKLHKFLLRETAVFAPAIVALLTATAINASAASAETWDCKYIALDGPNVENHGIIKVSGDQLLWQIETVIPGSKFEIQTTQFRSRILQNSAVGIVAASWQSRIDTDAGRVISAEVTVLDKGTGAFRVGDVSVNGLHESIKGHCRLK